MPFANDGNLRNYIKNNTLILDKKIEIAIDITEGIKFLHENDIIHENLVCNLIFFFYILTRVYLIIYRFIL
jgi:serine/threonine protein kinase